MWRGQSGGVVVSDAYCPHLGANLAVGGTVVGDDLRCPFHGFRFDRTGACVATGYGGKPPAKASLFTYPTCEQNGAVFAYYDEDGASPAWRLPSLDASTHGPFVFQVHRFRGHPQETSENSVDLGHLRVLHGYENVEMLAAPMADGPCLNTRYAFTRTAEFLGRPDVKLRTELKIAVWGLGYSLVEGHDDTFHIRYRILVLAVATDVDRVECRLGIALDTRGARQRSVAFRLLPERVQSRLLAHAFMIGVGHDFTQDVPLWSSKRYLENPALAAGDGPIGLYRRWARQFYARPGKTASRAL